MEVILVLLAVVALVAGVLILFQSQGRDPAGWGITALSLLHLIPLL